MSRSKGNAKLKFGKYKGKALKDIPFNYLRWLAKQEFAPAAVKRFVKDHEEFI